LFDGFRSIFSSVANGLTASEVDVSRRQLIQALEVSIVVVLLDELVDILFELSWQVVVPRQDSILPCAIGW
jgi:hypothetical protein